MQRLIMFAKYPVPGKVKTRLGKGIGMEQAAKLQRDFIEQLIAAHKDQTYEFIISCPNEQQEVLFRKEYNVNTILQPGNNLGEKMHNMFKRFDGKTILIGSDLPDFSAQDAKEIFEQAEENDLVLGPSTDGGFYAICMIKPHDVFSGITYSVETVLSETLKRAAELKLAVATVRTRTDIDTKEDLEKYLENSTHSQ